MRAKQPLANDKATPTHAEALPRLEPFTTALRRGSCPVCCDRARVSLAGGGRRGVVYQWPSTSPSTAAAPKA